MLLVLVGILAYYLHSVKLISLIVRSPTSFVGMTRRNALNSVHVSNRQVSGAEFRRPSVVVDVAGEHVEAK